ncbi:MAG: porin family protein [Elusimicrobiota bacterium]
MNRLLRKTIFLTLIAGLGAPSFAQDLDKEIERPGYATESQENAVETAGEARKRETVEGSGEITYAQILEDPDNIDLNYRYAKLQVERGDLRGAVATLERILMVDPALPKVRLFYAVVLYRLDNLPEAERELTALRKLPMPASLLQEIDEYLKRIRRRTRRTNFDGSLGFGLQYDVNRNAAPATGRRLFGGVPVPLTTGLRQDDTSVLLMAAARVEHDLGTQAGHKLFGELSYYRAEQTAVDTLDLQAYAFQLGAAFKRRWGDVTPSAVFDHIRLSEETYLRTRGAQLRYDKKYDNRTALFARLRVAFHDYIKTTDVPTATERTGHRTDFSYGGSHILNPTMRLGLDLGFSHQDARKGYNRYDRHEVRGTHAWLLGKGRFLLTSMTLHVDRYSEPDTAIFNQRRADDTVRLGSTFGAPLGLIAPPLKDLLWTFTYEYFHSNSNIENYGYTNNKVSTMFTYRWEL